MSVPIPKELHRIQEPERECSYLPDELASLEYRWYLALEPAELEELLSRGWRRFGAYIFRPACRLCKKCVPIRVDIENFQPSKTQRKIIRKNQHITVSLHKATLTQDHIQLYNEWHVDMTERSGWRLQQTNPEDYEEGFLSGNFDSGYELRYFAGDKLVGVGLVDLLPNSMSSAYFYHAPDWRPLGPGTFSLLMEIEFARQQGLQYLYLGYWIEGCSSMNYKNRFEPNEVLPDRPTDQQSPLWTRPDLS